MNRLDDMTAFVSGALENIANAIIFVARDDARFTTGSRLVVDSPTPR